MSGYPAGSYRVIKEEELIEGLSYPVFLTTSTSIQIPAIGTPSMTKQFIPVTGGDLTSALEIDARLATSVGSMSLGDPSRD